MVEIEAKIAITRDECQSIKKRLIEQEHLHYRVIRETNTYWDKEGNLTTEGKALRIRKQEVDSYVYQTPEIGYHEFLADEDGETILTYKGPLIAAPLKKREEIEIPLPAGVEMAIILSRLGMQVSCLFTKHRVQFDRDLPEEESIVAICLDEIQDQTYLEVEAEEERLVLDTLKWLGVEDRPIITKGYPELVRASS